MKHSTRLRILAVALLIGSAPYPARAEGPSGWCAKSVTGARDAVWAHRESASRQDRLRAASVTSSWDVGEIAVLQDQGDLARLRNPVDLAGIGLQLTPVTDGYRVVRVDRPLSADTGTILALGDDDSRDIPLPFTFHFHGTGYDRVFVNSDGNLTFGAGDNASTARSLGRFLAGPPRIAPLFADFDPEAGGRVTTTSRDDRFTVSWRNVPQYGETDRNTFEVTLRADGTLELVYDAELNAGISEGVAGIAPGSEAGGLTPIDLSAPAGAEGSGALAEGFSAEDSLDETAVARAFFSSHGDDYMQLVVFTSRRLTGRDTFAYEQTVKNEDTGLGVSVVDWSADFGSAGNLQSFVMMDDIAKYPEDLDDPFLGSDSALAVLAHETGHRWLAQARFRDGNLNSRELLGRDEVHWSFFFDSDASHLEGNDIEDLGGGQFRTVAAGQRYSALDQYLMGLLPPEGVEPMFLVSSPQGLRDSDPGRDPRPGISFSGERKDLSIDDVLTALGPRNPPAGVAPSIFRQAFIYVAVGGPPDTADIEAIERFRQAWEPHFAEATGGRGTVHTHLE
jgi:hypothetical protein